METKEVSQEVEGNGKPQEPKKPYPYLAENVTFENKYTCSYRRHFADLKSSLFQAIYIFMISHEV